PAFRAHVPVRSARSGRRVRARASCGTPARPPRSARSGGRRCRAPRGSTPSRVHAVLPSRAQRSPAPRALSEDGLVLAERGRRYRSWRQVGKVLLYQVKRISQIARFPDLDRSNLLAVGDCSSKRILELERLAVAAKPVDDRPPESPKRRARKRAARLVVADPADEAVDEMNARPSRSGRRVTP